MPASAASQQLKGIAAAVALGMAGPAMAGPWAPPGDLQLRHDLQLLADYDLLRAPLTTWPVAFGDIAANLRVPDGAAGLSPAVRNALSRVQSRLRQEARTGFEQPALMASVAEEPVLLRSFADTPREEAALGAGLAWMGKNIAWRLQATAVADPDDDKTGRLDGSYAGVALGNWILSVSALPRWWGPGWDGSLILGTAARPVPAVTIERNSSQPFDLPVLRWLGPWKLVAFAGQLESDRYVPEARLLGMRATIKPTSKLEIGASRTAQWGGEGRPEDFDSFIDLLAGNDNVGDSGVTRENEPGNQLAGIDFRWQSPLIGRLPYAIYGQLIGEDEAGGAPSRSMGMVGLEHWGGLADISYRIYAEWADTTCNFYDDNPRYNCAYEHSIYRSGYRYRGRPLGHALDNDSRMLSLGLVLVGPSGALWSLQLQQAELNRDDAASLGGNSLSLGAKSDLLRAFVTHRRAAFAGDLDIGLGAERRETNNQDDIDPQAYLRWSVNWN